MSKHTYSRNGRPISEDEALDRKGALRDGVSMHVPHRLRDSDTGLSAMFTDGTSDGGGNRPGFRLRIGDNRKAQNDAISAYDKEISNRWKCGDGQQVCSSCSGSGIDPDDPDDSCIDCGGSGVTNIDNGYEQSAGEAFQNTAADKRTVDQRVKDHARNMARIYDAYDQNLGQMYRSK